MNELISPAKAPMGLTETFVAPPIEPGTALVVEPAVKRPKRKTITTIALTVNTCRWPVGDPTAPDFHYCGERPLVGQPYCETHDSQSYQTARRKKSVA